MLKKHYERDCRATGLAVAQMHSKGRSCHEYASLLKLWLRELTEPLVPKVLYDDAIAIGKQGPGEGPRQLAIFLAKMPTENKRIVTRLSEFLKGMDVRKTHMNHTNLAIVFAPCFLRHEDINVFMANRDFEMEFTRRVIVYAGGEDLNYAAKIPTPKPVEPAVQTMTSWGGEQRTVPLVASEGVVSPPGVASVIDGILQLPDSTPTLNSVAAAAVEQQPPDADVGPELTAAALASGAELIRVPTAAVGSPGLAQLRRERSAEARSAMAHACAAEHEARLVAMADEQQSSAG
jgi:hypothetical protein